MFIALVLTCNDILQLPNILTLFFYQTLSNQQAFYFLNYFGLMQILQITMIKILHRPQKKNTL